MYIPTLVGTIGREPRQHRYEWSNSIVVDTDIVTSGEYLPASPRGGPKAVATSPKRRRFGRASAEAGRGLGRTVRSRGEGWPVSKAQGGAARAPKD
jgi:hypothetical protein